MQIIDALKTIRDQPQDGDTWPCDLICGFTPLHLQTFLTAELIRRSEHRRIELSVGLFDDLNGTLERVIDERKSRSAAVVIEWSDLDPRLGYRSTGGWRPDRVADVVQSAALRLEQFARQIRRLAGDVPVALVLPTLPLPPLFQSSVGMAGPDELELRQSLAAFASQLAREPSVRIVSPQQLDRHSPPGERHNATSHLRTGFPYTTAHAGQIAACLADTLLPATPLKGIITDLDNTFWAGIVGDDGIDSVSWDLDNRSHHHGLYQELLASLADLGVLIGVASKNDPAIAEAALQRRDLVFPADRLFPVEASWEPKSQSVSRILQAWNVGADAVVFIDDNPMELAEVSQGVPGIHCRQFPARDADAVLGLLTELRSLFGKTTVSREDRLRLDSLKSQAEFAQTQADTDGFLSAAEAQLNLEWNQPDDRSLELVNKTNQFNLNGARLTESEWRHLTGHPKSILLGVNYRDKFGPLGKIAVVAGRVTQPDILDVSHWVMSCRAFSRRIEHATIQALFRRTGCSCIRFHLIETDRNGPLRQCLRELCGIDPVTGPLELSHATFETNCPEVFAEVTDDEFIRNPHAA